MLSQKANGIALKDKSWVRLISVFCKVLPSEKVTSSLRSVTSKSLPETGERMASFGVNDEL